MLEAATLAEYQRIAGEYGHHYRVDPAENDPTLATVLLRTFLEVEVELAGQDRGMGFCHLFWRTKKRVLREKYGVEWQSPQELNEIVFD